MWPANRWHPFPRLKNAIETGRDMTTFLIPKIGEFEPRDDMVNALLESIAYSNWRTGSSEYQVFSVPTSYLTSIQNKAIPHNMVPVGSLEFVNEILRLQNCNSVHPLNVPQNLAKVEITGRKMVIAQTKELLLTAKTDPRIFAKSMTRIKASENGPYDDAKEYPEDIWQVSDILENIVAEYRVIGFKEQILHVARYAGAIESPACDIRFARMCIECWTDKPPAYTIDIGVLPDGRCVILEAHNFISCGLYGMSCPDKFIPMVVRAIRWEQQKGEKYGAHS